MKVNISQFLDWLTCPYLAKVKHTYRRWVPPTGALGVGTSFHRGMELKRAGKPLSGLDLAWALQPCTDPKDVKAATKLLSAIANFTMPEGTSKASEASYALPFGAGHQLVGRLDGLWECPEGKTWSEQDKSISSSRPIAQELERVRLSHHEVAYHKLAQFNGIKLAGTLVIVGVKLTDKAEKAGQTAMFHEYMERTDAETDLLWEGLQFSLQRYVADMEADPILRNTQSCLGKYGNSPCPLFTHCHQGADLKGIIDTYLTEELTDRYAEFPED